MEGSTYDRPSNPRQHLAPQQFIDCLQSRPGRAEAIIRARVPDVDLTNPPDCDLRDVENHARL
ncbi:MAG: hypothetical protein M1826_002976 [Phylliscum demangeonii]|nr:MAG: hypothetical protein M1826_002976 [Phylliscum demangeonii]